MFARSLFIRCRDGAAAIEFALVAPIFILTLLTMIAFALYLAAAHAVQQLAADSARVAVAGLDAAERGELAEAYIEDAATRYALIDPAALSVSVADDSTVGRFTVSLSYDAAGLPIWNLFTYALPDRTIERYATIRIGGI